MAFTNGMRPVHPGEILKEDFLKPLNMTGYALAKALAVPATRINDILLLRRGVTADTALRLARYFGDSSQSNAAWWLSLQATHDLRKAEILWQKKVNREVKPRTQALKEESEAEQKERKTT